MHERNNVIMFLGIILFFLSMVLFIKHSWFIPLTIYASILILSGLYYRANKYFLWIAIITVLPFAILVYFQFLKRLFYLILYGGEQANGIGSPLLFLLNFLYELPFTVLVSFICFGIYKDLKNKLL